MVEETLSALSDMLMARTRTTATAGASRFIAVPIRVWSALNLMAATPKSRENSIPKTTLAKMTRTIITTAGEDAGRYFIINAPPSAPITMMPSKPMLITPLCSEKQPPSATKIKTEAKIKVY